MGLGVGAARHHGVSSHRHHSHTDDKATPEYTDKATPESGLMDKDESNKDEEGTHRIQGPRDGLLPPPSERILTGVLEKKTMTSKGLHWKKRNAVLSRDYLSFGKLIEDWYVRAQRWAKFFGLHAPSHHSESYRPIFLSPISLSLLSLSLLS